MWFVYPNRKGSADTIVISNLYSTLNTSHGTGDGQIQEIEYDQHKAKQKLTLVILKLDVIISWAI